MSRPALEVADIFRDHGAAWRAANAGHVGLPQMKVMGAIESCRTAAHQLLCVPATEPQVNEDVAMEHVQKCPCCGGRMHVIETFAAGTHPNHSSSAPAVAIRIDTS